MGTASFALPKAHSHVDRFCATAKLQFDAFIRLAFVHGSDQLREILNFLAVEAEDDIAGFDAGTLGRGIGPD